MFFVWRDAEMLVADYGITHILVTLLVIHTFTFFA